MKNKVGEILCVFFIAIFSGFVIPSYALEGRTVIYRDVPKGFVLSVSESVFFDDGAVELNCDSKCLLDEIVQMLSESGNFCIVEGNTGSGDYIDSIYNSDWELSIIRAEKIVEYFISNGGLNSEKIRAIGFGDRRFPGGKDIGPSINFVIFGDEKGSKFKR